MNKEEILKIPISTLKDEDMNFSRQISSHSFEYSFRSHLERSDIHRNKLFNIISKNIQDLNLEELIINSKIEIKKRTDFGIAFETIIRNYINNLEEIKRLKNYNKIPYNFSKSNTGGFKVYESDEKNKRTIFEIDEIINDEKTNTLNLIEIKSSHRKLSKGGFIRNKRNYKDKPSKILKYCEKFEKFNFNYILIANQNLIDENIKILEKIKENNFGKLEYIGFKPLYEKNIQNIIKELKK